MTMYVCEKIKKMKNEIEIIKIYKKYRCIMASVCKKIV